MGRRGYRDRRQAGRRLAALLAPLAEERPVVIALPRGGVPVAYEIAAALDAPLDVLLVRKVGAPGNPELGIGAVAEGGVRFLSEGALRSLRITPEQLQSAVARSERELQERLLRYRGERPPIDVAGRAVILVDDGLATGGTAHAAAQCLRERGPARIVLAVPVGAAESIEVLRPEFDEIVCPLVPEPMWAIGSWYERFGQVSDDEVSKLLGIAPAQQQPVPSGAADAHRKELRIALEGGEEIAGDLVLPERAGGLVVFAHGSGSSRRSSRNRRVAATLAEAGLATLLVDLLTPGEERLRANVFDIELLAERLQAATTWARRQPGLAEMDIGYFGASTGAGAALWAAAALGDRVRAVVSRGGRPDLAAERLAQVRAPTLLIVGGNDEVVLDLNRRALALLRCAAHLHVVPGATHLFEEPGALEEVARLAADWFTSHLTGTPAQPQAT